MYFSFISNMILKYKLIFVIHEYNLLVFYWRLFLYVNLSETFAFTLSKFVLKRVSLTFVNVHHLVPYINHYAWRLHSVQYRNCRLYILKYEIILRKDSSAKIT